MDINEKIILIQLFIQIAICYYKFCDDRHNNKVLSSVN